MKFLIWFGCVLIVSILTAVARMSGIILGAIPMMILYGGMVWVATTLCKKWDERHKNKD